MDTILNADTQVKEIVYQEVDINEPICWESIDSIDLETANNIIDFLRIIGYKHKDFISLKAINGNHAIYKTFQMPKDKIKSNHLYNGKQSIFQKLDQLMYLSMQGYGIYICPQIRYRYVGAKDQHYGMDGNDYIQFINNVLIESDTLTIDDQQNIFKHMKDYCRCAVLTGNKSLHMWINVGFVNNNEKELNDLQRTRISIINHLQEIGISMQDIDMHVFNNINQSIRMPYFIHNKSGNTSTIYSINNNSIAYNWAYDIIEDIDDHNANLCNDVITNEANSVSTLNNTATVEGRVCKARRKNNDYKNRYLLHYQPFMTNGIKKGKRNTMYYVITRYNREIYPLSRNDLYIEKCIADVKNILCNENSEYDLTLDEALKDYCKYINNIRFKNNMPYINYKYSEFNKDNFIYWLKENDYDYIHNRRSMLKNMLKLLNYLWELWYQCPMQAMDGRLEIPQTNMRKHMSPQLQSKCKNELIKLGIMTETKNYNVGINSYNYYINMYKLQRINKG